MPLICVSEGGEGCVAVFCVVVGDEFNSCWPLYGGIVIVHTTSQRIKIHYLMFELLNRGKMKWAGITDPFVLVF
jgi:hypothetical protein